MDRLRPYPVTVFCAVTLFIWTNRIWLAWTNDTDTVAAKLAWSIPITLFEVATIAIVVALLTGADRHARWFTLLVQGVAGVTIAYWAVRMPMILVNEHDLKPDEEMAFKAVHAVLATASITTAVLAWRAMARLRPDPSAVGSPVT